MKLRQALNLYHGLAKVKNIPNTKISYAIIKNEKILKPLIEKHQPEPTKEMKAYWEELGTCKTDEDKSQCHKKHAKTLDAITKLQADWEETLNNTEITPLLHTINPDEFPDNLTAQQIEILDNLV